MARISRNLAPPARLRPAARPADQRQPTKMSLSAFVGFPSGLGTRKFVRGHPQSKNSAGRMPRFPACLARPGGRAAFLSPVELSRDAIQIAVTTPRARPHARPPAILTLEQLPGAPPETINWMMATRLGTPVGVDKRSFQIPNHRRSDRSGFAKSLRLSPASRDDDCGQGNANGKNGHLLSLSCCSEPARYLRFFLQALRCRHKKKVPPK